MSKKNFDDWVCTKDIEDWIPLEKCIDGNVYLISARNGSVGVYNEEKKAFYLARRKFGDTFLFPEFHWDTGAPYGTAKPLEDLGKSPNFADEEQEINYLLEKEREYDD